MRMSRDELAERIARHVAEDSSGEAAPGLFLYRFSSPTGPRYGVTEPSFCVIAQGSKEVLLGKERYRYDASHYLLVSAELPVAGHIVDASKEQPYLAVRLVLDPAVVTEVLIQAGLHASGMDDAIKVMAVSRLDASLLDAVVRVVASSIRRATTACLRRSSPARSSIGFVSESRAVGFVRSPSAAAARIGSPRRSSSSARITTSRSVSPASPGN